MPKNRINIYIEPEDRKKIDELKCKYQLSLTTIVDILISVTYWVLKNDLNNTEIERVMQNNLYLKGNKTSIKMPRNFKNETYNEVNKSAFANNVLNIYLKKEINLFVKHTDLITAKYGYYNTIHKEMQKTYDPRWQYNENLRNQINIVKRNKEYFRKILG